MTLESNKIMGGIGAILLLVGVAGFVVEPLILFVAFVGAILGLIALHGLADYYHERGIFNNGLWAFIVLIVGVVVAVGVLVYLAVYTNTLTQLVYLLYPTWNGDWTTLPSTPQVSPSDLNVAAIVPLITPLLEVYALLCVFLLIASFFVWRSLRQMSMKSNERLFGTAGLILFIGGLLTFIIIGFIVIAFALILTAVAFFQLKQQPQTEQPIATYSPLPPVPPAPTI